MSVVLATEQSLVNNLIAATGGVLYNFEYPYFSVWESYETRPLLQFEKPGFLVIPRLT